MGMRHSRVGGGALQDSPGAHSDCPTDTPGILRMQELSYELCIGGSRIAIPPRSRGGSGRGRNAIMRSACRRIRPDMGVGKKECQRTHLML